MKTCLAGSALIISSAIGPAAAQEIAPAAIARQSSIVNPNVPQRLPLVRPPIPSPETQPAAGSADPRNIPPRYGILGNLGGLRDLFWQKGILLNSTYDYQAASNIQGGVRGPILRGAGQFAVRALVDFDRMLGIEGGTGALTITNRQGRDVTSDARLGTQTSVEEIFGRGHMWRLSQMWYNQRLTPWMDFKIGRIPLSDDFAGFACEFQLLALCGNQPGKLVGSYWHNFPVSQWAARLRLSIPDMAYAQFGAYQVNPSNIRDGFTFDFSEGTGALFVGEVGVTPKFGDLQYVGSYKVGAWIETGGGNDIYLNSQGQPLSISGGTPLYRNERTGVFAVGVQEVFRPNPEDPTRNLSVFLRVTYVDQATSLYWAQETAGFIYKGMFADRPNDWIGFGVGQTLPNPRVIDGLVQTNASKGTTLSLLTQERFMEIFYSIAITNDFVVRPNVQYINRPSGLSLRSDVVVIGLKSALNF